jgi:hypothetical protein
MCEHFFDPSRRLANLSRTRDEYWKNPSEDLDPSEPRLLAQPGPSPEEDRQGEELKDDGKDNHCENGFVIQETHCRAAEKLRDSIPRIEESEARASLRYR